MLFLFIQINLGLRDKKIIIPQMLSKKNTEKDKQKEFQAGLKQLVFFLGKLTRCKNKFLSTKNLENQKNLLKMLTINGF